MQRSHNPILTYRAVDGCARTRAACGRLRSQEPALNASGAARRLLPPSLDFELVKEMFAALDAGVSACALGPGSASATLLRAAPDGWAFAAQNVVTLLSALFGECRIIFSASSHYRIKAVINTLLRLMYPFQWQHLCVLASAPARARAAAG
jgi:hypothetical protein